MPRTLGPTESHELAEELTQYIAKRISQAIDAGSERDAISEDLFSLMKLYVDTWAKADEAERIRFGLVTVEWHVQALLKAADHFAVCFYG